MLLAFVMMVGMLVPAIGSAAEYESTDFKVDYYGKEEPEESEELFSQPLNDGNFCAIKQGSGYVIVWSEDALTEDERTAIEGIVKAKDPSTVGAHFKFTTEHEIDGAFITGQNNWGIYTIAKDANGNYEFKCDGDKISHLDYGKYTRPVKEIGQWVPVATSSDSCTGYGLINSNVGKSWFLKQTLNTNDEYPISLDIIAGNPKNGTNVVGALTVSKVNDAQYQLSYKFNEQAQPVNPEIGDTYTAVLVNDAHYNYTGSGIAINKAPSQNMDLTNGVTFAPQVKNNQYDLFAHFSITEITYEYQVPPVAE